MIRQLLGDMSHHVTEVVWVTGKPCSHRHAVDDDQVVHPSAHPPLAEREELETEDGAVLTTPHVFLPRPPQGVGCSHSWPLAVPTTTQLSWGLEDRLII